MGNQLEHTGLLMEKVVYITIGVFAAIILLLFIYILFEKLVEVYRLKKIRADGGNIAKYLDSLVSSDEAKNKYLTEHELNNIAEMLKNKIKREIIIERLLFLFENSQGNERSKLMALVKEIGLVEYEIENLKSRHNYKVSLACRRLGEFRSKEASPKILELLDKSASTEVEYHALMALAKIGDIESFTKAFDKIENRIGLTETSLVEIADSFEGSKAQLYREMIHSKNQYIATVFIKSAGNSGNASLVDDIAKYIGDSDAGRKVASIKALGFIGNGALKYQNEIIELLRDESWEVRAVAAKTLGMIESQKAIPELGKALEDNEWWVRFNSAWSLVKLPCGLQVLEEVLERTDRFAREILISSLENSGVLSEPGSFHLDNELDRHRLIKSVNTLLKHNNCMLNTASSEAG